ncbi:STM3941 family protein [Chryseobacterium wangxinyae]|uniref:STM3941 family protein n=1 Tax=Chryseobacterium sp. CY353 TaxID=2997334 RepID=UPI00226D60E4|nr:STM3941 family protein [Chryseobacterium sp. CY353]MCY0969752.1 hypothetical protein [Chryseobacterium sp. CY353]
MKKIEEQIEIRLSKVKMIMMFIGGLSLFVIGLLLVFFEPGYIDYTSRRSWIMRPIPRFLSGLLLIIFFGFFLVFILIKLFDKKKGIIINKIGIIDNSSGLSVGLVLWSDIKEIEIVTINHQKLIMLILKNPQDYLNKVTSKLKRKGMQINYKWYGSPISISANTLQISHKDLFRLISEKMEQYKEENY